MIPIRCFIIPLLVIGLEAGVQWWRHSDPAVSKEPAFIWRGAPMVAEAEPPFGRALAVYHADRGAHRMTQLGGGMQLEVLYFEWDDVEAGPFAIFTGHDSEVCNVAAGFRLLSTGTIRRHEFAGGEKLEFRHTFLESPAGDVVHAYKAVWIQGEGDWHTGSSLDRGLRLKRSFVRLRGPARVLQGGVFGVTDEDAAWNAFSQKVLSEVVWADPV